MLVTNQRTRVAAAGELRVNASTQFLEQREAVDAAGALSQPVVVFLPQRRIGKRTVMLLQGH